MLSHLKLWIKKLITKFEISNFIFTLIKCLCLLLSTLLIHNKKLIITKLSKKALFMSGSSWVLRTISWYYLKDTFRKFSGIKILAICCDIERLTKKMRFFS